MSPDERIEIIEISERLQCVLDELERVENIIPVIDDMACRLKLIAMVKPAPDR